ncbi:hypothetical protein BJV82DRAFT_611233 [Fennellomyces sp. T-0311]|nr:hypothetical protein BJV82DRAFT_611233 [Fennellomyces sp. T-0311]
MKTHLNAVFSFTQLSQCTLSIATQASIPIVLRFPDPRQPNDPAILVTVALNSRSKSDRNALHGKVLCHDYQTVEAVYSLVSQDEQEQRMKAATLLLNNFSPVATNYSFIAIDILLKDNYIWRSCRLPNMSWARRMWGLASRASMISFTSMYYSVLGGAYSSLSKANANYAYKAGSLAIQQIKFAQWLRDPILESKCWLYYAEDLIQLHKFKRADKIVARQLEFAEQIGDPILLKMCDSVLAKRNSAYKEYAVA